MSKEKGNTGELYEKNINTDGVTENVAGEQTIQTSETKILKGKDKKEVLIGKKIEKVEEVKEGHESLKKRILQKLMK